MNTVENKTARLYRKSAVQLALPFDGVVTIKEAEYRVRTVITKQPDDVCFCKTFDEGRTRLEQPITKIGARYAVLEKLVGDNRWRQLRLRVRRRATTIIRSF